MESKFEEIKDIMTKISVAMGMSKDKQKMIDIDKKKLLNEVAPYKAKMMEEDINVKEEEKNEFDEMTITSLKNVARNIKEEKKLTEENLLKDLLELDQKRKEMNRKLEKYENRKDVSEEILTQARNSAQKALINNEENKKKTFVFYENVRKELDDLDNKVSDYAMYLGIEDIIEQIRRENTKEEEVISKSDSVSTTENHEQSSEDETKKEDNQSKQTDTVNGFRVTTTPSPIVEPSAPIKEERKKEDSQFKQTNTVNGFRVTTTPSPTVEPSAPIKEENKKEENQFKQTNTVNGFRVTTIPSPIITIPKNANKEPKESKGIENIIISERNGNAIIEFNDGEKCTSDIRKIFENKKDIYGKANIKEICKNIAGNKIRGLLLNAKVNPVIVDLLQNYSEPEVMQEYIQCLNDKKELPFELVHDLRDSKLGIMNRLKMWVCARAEDKIPGTKITFVTRLWNKNKAMPEKSQVATQDESSKTEKSNEYSKKLGDREDIKVDNKNNRIETKAQEKMQEEKVQENIGKNVEQIMNEEKGTGYKGKPVKIENPDGTIEYGESLVHSVDEVEEERDK